MSPYQFACRAADVPEGTMRLVELSDRLVIVVNSGGRFYCIDDVCTHDGGPLSDGELNGVEVKCPRHGARFDIRTGKALCMPATEDTMCHEVKLDGPDVYVRINES